MQTAFSSDFDNTLHFNQRGGISASDIEAIAAYRAQGGLFGINTGRSAGSLNRTLQGEIEVDFLITASGAMVQGPGGKLYFDCPLPRDLALELLARYRWPSLGLCLAVSDLSWAVAPLSWVPPLARRVSDRGVITLSQLPKTIYGLSLRFFRVQDASRVAASMRRRYGDDIAVYQNMLGVDVVAGGCSKGEGLRIVQRELGIDRMGAIGDSYNDVAQFEAADVAYTFSSSPDHIRAAADVLVPSVEAALEDFTSRW